MSRDRFYPGPSFVCAPPGTGTGRASATRAEEDGCETRYMSIQEASRQALADLEGAEKARQDYANAIAQRSFDYKVDE